MEERAISDLSTSEDELSDLNEQLQSAIKDGDLTEVKRLVEVEHVDPNLCTYGDKRATPLHLASDYGHLDIVRYLVEERNCDLECRTEYESTPLHYAALEGRLDIVQYLISERGSDMECTNKSGETPLHCAALGGALDIVQYLVSERGCDPMCRDQFGHAPLHKASQCGHLDIVRFLIEEKTVIQSVGIRMRMLLSIVLLEEGDWIQCST